MNRMNIMKVNPLLVPSNKGNDDTPAVLARRTSLYKQQSHAAHCVSHTHALVSVVPVLVWSMGWEEPV